MSTSTKLIDLAKAELSKDKDAKALELVEEQVEENKIGFDLALHTAKKEAKEAAKAVASLAKNPTATPAAVIVAEDDLAIKNKTVEQLTAVIASRF